jgi:hypothetical protein
MSALRSRQATLLLMNRLTAWDRQSWSAHLRRRLRSRLRNHGEIVRAHANRESPKSAALPFPQCSNLFGRRCHGFSLRGGRILQGNGLQDLNDAGGVKRPAGALWKRYSFTNDLSGRLVIFHVRVPLAPLVLDSGRVRTSPTAR